MEPEVIDVEAEETSPPTLTINDKEYLIDDLSDKVKELISLYDQAQQMSVAAKRQAAIHDVSIDSLVKMVEEELQEKED
jgi:hypothetical protein